MKFKKNIISKDRIFWSDQTKANVAKAALNLLIAKNHKLPACEVIREAQLCLVNKKLRRPDASNIQALKVVKSIMPHLTALGVEMTPDKQLKISPPERWTADAPQERLVTAHHAAFSAPYGKLPIGPVKDNLNLNTTSVFDNARAHVASLSEATLQNISALQEDYRSAVKEISDKLDSIVLGFTNSTGFLTVQAVSQKPQGIRIPRILLVGVPPSLRATVTKKLSIYKDHAQIIFANRMGEVIPAHEAVFILTNYGISEGVNKFWTARSSEADNVAHRSVRGLSDLVEGIKSYLNQ